MLTKLFLDETSTNHQDFADKLSDRINHWLNEHPDAQIKFIDFRLAGNAETSDKWLSIISVLVHYTKGRTKVRNIGGVPLKNVRVKIFLDETNMDHQDFADKMSDRVNDFLAEEPEKEVHFIDQRITGMAVSSGGWTALGVLVQYSPIGRSTRRR